MASDEHSDRHKSSLLLRDTLNFLQSWGFQWIWDCQSMSAAQSVTASPSRSHHQFMQSSDFASAAAYYKASKPRLPSPASSSVASPLCLFGGWNSRTKRGCARALGATCQRSISTQVCVRDGFDRSIAYSFVFDERESLAGFVSVGREEPSAHVQQTRAHGRIWLGDPWSSYRILLAPWLGSKDMLLAHF
jgi:hypothetical protein